MRLRALILLPFLLGLSVALKAQTSVTLEPGVPLERTLGPSQVHEFTVNTKANSLVQLVVEQKGIDVVIKIATPDGKSLAECDTPNGDKGSELVSFVAKEAGKYRIAIVRLNSDDSTTGSYQITLTEVREATEEEIASSKNRDEAKAKGIALLLELRDAMSQIKSGNTRINAQLRAANLLRDHDEKAATKYLMDAVAEFKEMFAAADAEEDMEESMSQFGALSQLRNEVIRILAETDPDAALNFLRSTAPRYNPYGNPVELANQESTLELSIADQIGRKDPNRALQIAKQNLKKAYSPSLINTASQLAEKNPELASDLMHDIATKLLNEDKLISKPAAATLAITMTGYYGTSDKGIKTTNSRIPTVQQAREGLVSEQDIKQLVQKMVREILTYSQTKNGGLPYGDAIWIVMGGLRSLGPELDKIVSGTSAALDKKQTELVGNNTQWVNQYQEIQTAIMNNPAEAAMEVIDKAPAEIREQLYIMLANKEASNGDLNRAKQIINDHVSNPYQKTEALRTIKQQEIDHAMSSGKIEDALKNIAAMRTPSARASQLTQLTSQIGTGQKRETALSLLEQARSLLPPSPQAQDQGQMEALLEIARAFGPYDSKRSFEIIDPLIDQFNDLCAAAQTLKGFGSEFFEDDELEVEGEGSLAQIAGQLSDVLGSMALINFDRAKASSDKLRLPEVRLHVQLGIAEQTITGKQSFNFHGPDEGY
jgi:hypothetical protein